MKCYPYRYSVYARECERCPDRAVCQECSWEVKIDRSLRPILEALSHDRWKDGEELLAQIPFARAAGVTALRVLLSEGVIEAKFPVMTGRWYPRVEPRRWLVGTPRLPRCSFRLRRNWDLSDDRYARGQHSDIKTYVRYTKGGDYGAI